MKTLTLTILLGLSCINATAAEIENPKIQNHLSLIKEQLESTLYGWCQWDNKVFTTPYENEFYTEFPCQDGDYKYKFGTWLRYGTEISFRAESYAASQSSLWSCLAEGKVVDDKVAIEISCKQIQ